MRTAVDSNTNGIHEHDGSSSCYACMHVYMCMSDLMGVCMCKIVVDWTSFVC